MAKWAIVALVLATFVPLAGAQMRGGFGGVHSSGFQNGFAFAGHQGNHFGPGLVYFGDPFFYSDYQPTTYGPPAVPVVIVQPSASPPVPAETKAEPLMIEWHGDHYVRFDGQPARNMPLDFARPDASSETRAKPERSAWMPPAILVFRDGHREQVSDYVITNGSLYARGNYWQDGFWTKTVQLPALDIPSTLRANSETGVKFVLPSGPNDVVTRP